jgi:hypothetical protein
MNGFKEVILITVAHGYLLAVDIDFFLKNVARLQGQIELGCGFELTSTRHWFAICPPCGG